MSSEKLSRRRMLGTSARALAGLSVGSALFPLAGCGDSQSSAPDTVSGTDAPDAAVDVAPDVAIDVGHDVIPDAGPPPEPPNVILITADDLGWLDLTCYGNDQVATPNIDRLADEGVKLDNAFVVSSSCAPSRASFITGQYPHTHGVTALTHLHPDRQLPVGHPTIASLLADAGYVTGIEGKWHVAFFEEPASYGYHEHLGGLLGSDIQDSERARDFIERHQHERFYLELNYMNNHRDGMGKFQFAPDFPVDPEAIQVPEYWALPDWPEIREDVAKYFSQTMEMDRLIGEVLDQLDELGLADNTAVLFVSDNGPPFPGIKMTCYDRGVRVPLLVRWPAGLPAGESRDAFVNSIDILPTLLDAAGVPVPESIQGQSFLPTLLGQPDAPERQEIFMEMTYHVDYLPMRAVRTARWKYIRNYSDSAFGLDQRDGFEWAHALCELPDQPWKRPRVPEELYDLDADPHEKSNLAEDPGHADTLAELQQLLDAHMAATDDPYLGQPFTNDYVPG